MICHLISLRAAPGAEKVSKVTWSLPQRILSYSLVDSALAKPRRSLACSPKQPAHARRLMSPLVQRSRPQNSQSNSTDQHWSMLLFESLSAGVGAVFLGFTFALVVVGIYVIIVWPLTFWDLANYGLEKYAGWVQTAIWSLFAGGTAAGF